MQALQIANLRAELPIVQGGMGVGVSLANLAGAVAAAGGVGIISGVQMGFKEADFKKNTLEANLRVMQEEVKKAKEIAQGRGVLGMNIMVAINNYADTVKAAIQSGIELLVCGAGLPLTLPKLVEGSNVKIAPIVSSGRAAKIILKSWWNKYKRLPDMVVVEGAKAGGHLGFKPEELIQKTYQSLENIVVDVRKVLKEYEEAFKVHIPVIAGGGINGVAETKALMAAGANAIQVATPFIATEECDADENYKKMYVEASAKDLRIIQSPAGLPGRAIDSPLIKRLALDRVKPTYCTHCLSHCNPATTPYCITHALMEAVQGRRETGLFFSGEGVGEINRITTVKDVIDRFLHG